MFDTMFKNMTAQTERFYQPAFELNRLVLGQLEKIGKVQLENFNSYAELSIQQVNALAKVKSPEDFKSIFENQAATASTLSEKALKDASQMVELGKAFAEELSEFSQKQAQAVWGEVEKATTTATKAAKKLAFLNVRKKPSCAAFFVAENAISALMSG